jgi:hypothetical protein
MLTRALFAAALICGTAAVCSAQETTVVAVGLADHKLADDELQSGATPATPKFNTAGVAYALVAHARKGDAIEVTLTKDGEPLMRNVREIEADEPGVLVQAGKTGVPAGGWPEGSYTASVKITRAGKTLAEQESDAVPFD